MRLKSFKIFESNVTFKKLRDELELEFESEDIEIDITEYVSEFDVDLYFNVKEISDSESYINNRLIPMIKRFLRKYNYTIYSYNEYPNNIAVIKSDNTYYRLRFLIIR